MPDRKTTARGLVVLASVAAAAAGAFACGTFSAADDPANGDAGADQAVGPADGSPTRPDGAPTLLDGAPDPATVSEAGCSDGTREAFRDTPAIAACDGAWTVPGVLAETSPQCNRHAGNDGTKPNGAACAAVDLCAQGWHVCTGASDVGFSGGAGTGPCGPDSGAIDAGAFYATAQTGGASGHCGNGGAAEALDDLFGCGAPQSGGCQPLNASLGTDTLPPNPLFAFGPDGKKERMTVLKFKGPGGVLCCKDSR